MTLKHLEPAQASEYEWGSWDERSGWTGLDLSTLQSLTFETVTWAKDKQGQSRPGIVNWFVETPLQRAAATLERLDCSKAALVV